MAANQSTLTVAREPAPSSRATPALIAAALAGGAVAVALGVYGRVHEPTGGRLIDLGFPSLQETKAWLSALVFALVMLQLMSALAMFGHLPGVKQAPRWVPFAHRWTGTMAFLVSLPVCVALPVGTRLPDGERPRHRPRHRGLRVLRRVRHQAPRAAHTPGCPVGRGR